MKIIGVATGAGTRVADRVALARSFLRRLIGLLRRQRLDPQQGLLLQPGGSVHTVGMRFAIDVVFLDENLTVLAVAANLRPMRMALAPRGTRSVLELAAGRAAACTLQPGTQLQLIHGG